MSYTKIARQLSIINLLSENANGLSKDTIISTIEYQFELQNESIHYLDLTFKRDINDIRTTFNIEIHYNRKLNIYEIGEQIINDSKIDLLLNSFKIFTSILSHSGLPKYIIPEQRKSSGINNFKTITDAISSKTYIEFIYFKFDSNTYENKKIKPLAIKESKSRWYVIGCYENKDYIRAFGLDRISRLEITNQNYKSEIGINDIKNYYNDSFAMFTNSEVENVVLSFDLRDGNYIISNPIHHSQKIEIQNENQRVIVSLRIKITLDFIMELMSRAWSLKIIKPDSLRKDMSAIFQEALERNKL